MCSPDMPVVPEMSEKKICPIFLCFRLCPICPYNSKREKSAPKGAFSVMSDCY